MTAMTAATQTRTTPASGLFTISHPVSASRFDCYHTCRPSLLSVQTNVGYDDQSYAQSDSPSFFSVAHSFSSSSLPVVYNGARVPSPLISKKCNKKEEDEERAAANEQTEAAEAAATTRAGTAYHSSVRSACQCGSNLLPCVPFHV